MDTITSGSWMGHLGRGLAPRELECVLDVAQGMTSKQIARHFGISEGGVEKRIAAAMFKLEVPRRAATDDSGPMRRDRRVPDRRIAQVRVLRKAKSFDYHA